MTTEHLIIKITSNDGYKVTWDADYTTDTPMFKVVVAYGKRMEEIERNFLTLEDAETWMDWEWGNEESTMFATDMVIIPFSVEIYDGLLEYLTGMDRADYLKWLDIASDPELFAEMQNTPRYGSREHEQELIEWEQNHVPYHDPYHDGF